MSTRRHFLIGSLTTAASATLAGGALAAPSSARVLSLLNLHTGERLKAAYWEAGDYVPDVLTAMNRLLRDYRTGEVHPIAPSLLDLATQVSAKLETNQTIEIISGYRSPQTNAALHAKSEGVATKSLHMQGQALDIHIPGVDLARLRDAALALQVGGVGYYPASNFVHIDVGRPRRW